MHATTHTCKNCGNHFKGKYCNTCGEKVYTEHDKSITHLFEEAFHFLSHFDGLLFHTVRTIFTRPGTLSLDYCNGKRKPYFKPLSFFLLLVVLYLIFPLFEGLNMQLQYYSQNAIYGAFARQKVASLLAAHHLTDAQLAEQFHHKAEKVSKFLLVIIIPFSALLLWLLSFRKRRYFFDQMVFAAELNSFYLLWGFLLLPLLLLLFEKGYYLLNSVYLPVADDAAALIINIPFCVFILLAARKFYVLKWWQAACLTLLFIVMHQIIIHVVYKFLLFVIVINQIH